MMRSAKACVYDRRRCDTYKTPSDAQKGSCAAYGREPTVVADHS